MSRRGAVFQLRLLDDEPQRLEDQAKEAGLSKADLIRKALGWDITGRPTRSSPPQSAVPTDPAGRPIDPDKQPGLAAIHQIARKLKGAA
jgi:hypothetical protein